jgi:octaprenyl-diphosphate synthase
MASTRNTALDWAARARDALAVLPAAPIRDTLADLADFVVERIA